METKRLYGDLRAIQDILSTISDDKSLAIFRVVAEQASGVESFIISRALVKSIIED